MLHTSVGTDLIFEDDANESNEIEIPDRPTILKIYAPAALDGVVKPYSSNDDGASFQVMRSSGQDVEIPAGSVVTLKYMAGEIVKLMSSVVQTEVRVFTTKILQEL